jgi:Tol biopolymer transport system component
MSVVEVRVEDGTVRPITSQRWNGVNQLAWLRDGSGLVMTAQDQASGRTPRQQIWALDYGTGEARRITNDLNSYSYVSLAADSSALVSVKFESRGSIWVISQGNTGRATELPLEAGVIDQVEGISWSPDGKIVFAGRAGDNRNIWSIDPSGVGQRQLTFDGFSGSPCVSPDGRYIVFVSWRTGTNHIWRIDIDGANSKQLVNGSSELAPQVSPDGRWVVYSTQDSRGEGRLWKVAIDGGDPVQLTNKQTTFPSISSDGRWIACLYRAEPSAAREIAVLPFEDGQPVKTFGYPPTAIGSVCIRWMPDGRAITYIDGANYIANIWTQPLDGGPRAKLTDFKDGWIAGYGWSPNGQQLACSRWLSTSEVILITDFR